MAVLRHVHAPVIDTYDEFQAYWNRMLDTELESNYTTDYALASADRVIPPPPGVPRALWLLARRPVMEINI